MAPKTLTGSQLRVLSDRLEEPGIKIGTTGYKASGLSTTPWRPLDLDITGSCYGSQNILLKEL